MDFSIQTQNQFAPLQNRTMAGGDNDDSGFVLVRNKKRCLSESPQQTATDSGDNFQRPFSQMSDSEKLNVIYMDIQNIKVSQREAQTGMNLLQQSLNDQSKNIDTVARTVNHNVDMLRLLSYKSIDIEARTRRCNLIFRNMTTPSPQDMNNPDRLIGEFLKVSLGIEGICIDRAHPLGPRRYMPKRDIIVAFKFHQDVENIMKNVYKLKGTSYVIDRDYPKEIVAARKRLWPKFKQARAAQPGAKVSIQFPAKLVVNGTTVENEFPDWFEYLRGSRDTYLRHVRYKTSPNGPQPDNDNIQTQTNNTIYNSQQGPYAGFPQEEQRFPQQQTPHRASPYHMSSDPNISFASVLVGGIPPSIHQSGSGILNTPPIISTVEHPISVASFTRPNTGVTADPQLQAQQSTRPRPPVSVEHSAPYANEITNSVNVTQVVTPTSQSDSVNISHNNTVVQTKQQQSANTQGNNTQSQPPEYPNSARNISGICATSVQPSIFRSSSPFNVPKTQTNIPVRQPSNNNSGREQSTPRRLSRSLSRSTDKRQSSASASRGRDQRSALTDQRRVIDSNSSDRPRTGSPPASNTG